jgi:hypothetical protein
MPPKKATGAAATAPREVPEIVRPPLEAVAAPEDVPAMKEPVADPICLDSTFPEWSDEMIESFVWGAAEGVESGVYEEPLPTIPANLACTIAAWKRPIDYMPQPEPEPPQEVAEGEEAPPPAEPVTMAGPGAWAEIEKDNDGRRLPKVVILPEKEVEASAEVSEVAAGEEEGVPPPEGGAESDSGFSPPKELHCEFRRSFTADQAKEIESAAAAAAATAPAEGVETAAAPPVSDKPVPAGDEADTVCVSAIRSATALVGSVGESVPFLWENVYPKDSNGRPSYNPAGKYLVKLFISGKWRAITIDDRVPVDANGDPVIAASANPQELWPTLLAKAVYKVYSSSYYASTHADLLRSTMGKTKGANSTGLGTFFAFVLQMLTGWMPQLLPKDWDADSLTQMLLAAGTPQHTTAEFNVDFEYQKLFRAMKMAAKKRKKKSKKKEVTQDDVDEAYEKRQVSTEQMKAELGQARNEVFVVCFAAENRKLPKPSKAAPAAVDEAPKEGETDPPVADAPPADTPAQAAAPPASLLPNASMEIYPVLGIVTSESEPKLLVRWAPKDAPPDPMADDGMSFKFLSISDLKKAGGTVVQMHTLASSNEAQLMRYHWSVPAPVEGEEAPPADAAASQSSLVYPGPGTTMLAHIAPSDDVKTITLHVCGDPDKLTAYKSQTTVCLQPFPFPAIKGPEVEEVPAVEAALAPDADAVAEAPTAESAEAEAPTADAPTAETPTAEAADAADAAEVEAPAAEAPAGGEEPVVDTAAVEQEAADAAADEVAVVEAEVEPTSPPEVKPLRIRLGPTATTPFATMTAKLPSTAEGILYKINLEAPAGAYIALTTTGGGESAPVGEAAAGTEVGGDEAAGEEAAAAAEIPKASLPVNLGSLDAVWQAVGGAYDSRSGDYGAVPSKVWTVIFRRVVLLPDEGCAVRLAVSVRDIGSRSFMKLVTINNDTNEETNPMLETNYESWAPAAKGYTVMLVAYSTSKPLPASSWELAVMSSAAVKDIQEVACSKVTRFGASYLPNKYYRLFRDVLSSSDLASLSLRLEVPDPSVCLMFRVFAADTLELLHETQARKVIQIHQLKPAAPPADGEVQSSSVIIDALLNEKTMAMPEHCKSRRPYFFSNEPASTPSASTPEPEARAEGEEGTAEQPSEEKTAAEEAAPTPELPSWLLTVVSGEDVTMSHDLAKEKAEAAVIDGWEEAEPGRQERARAFRAMHLDTGKETSPEGEATEEAPLEAKRADALALEEEEDREKESARVTKRTQLPVVAEKLVGTESDQAGDQTYVLAHLRHAVLPEASDVVVLNQEEIEAEITTRATVISDSATQLETAGEELAKYREELSKLFGTQRSDIEGLRSDATDALVATFVRRKAYRQTVIDKVGAFEKLKEQGGAAVQQAIEAAEEAAAEARGEAPAKGKKKK